VIEPRTVLLEESVDFSKGKRTPKSVFPSR
jgi:hypothetical protein